MAGNAKTSTAKRSIRSRRTNAKKTGKSRRTLVFKQNRPAKSPVEVSAPVTAEILYYKGSFFSVGDIVSLMDVGGGIYYAQIRGLLQDKFHEKSAVLTWLLPTRSSPKDHFDPTTYYVGPDDEMPRKLECLEFICHAPSDYFQAKNSPYPTIPYKPESGYIWTRFGPNFPLRK